MMLPPCLLLPTPGVDGAAPCRLDVCNTGASSNNTSLKDGSLAEIMLIMEDGATDEAEAEAEGVVAAGGVVAVRFGDGVDSNMLLNFNDLIVEDRLLFPVAEEPSLLLLFSWSCQGFGRGQRGRCRGRDA